MTERFAAAYEQVMKKQDALKILNLAEGVSLEEARTAYRELAKKYHPDLAGDKPGRQQQAESRMKEINLAYKMIAPGLKAKPKKRTVGEKNRRFSWASLFKDVSRVLRKAPDSGGKHRPKARHRKPGKTPVENFETVFIRLNPDRPRKRIGRTAAKVRSRLDRQRTDLCENYQKYINYKRTMKKMRRSQTKETGIGRIEKIQAVNPVDRIKR